MTSKSVKHSVFFFFLKKRHIATIYKQRFKKISKRQTSQLKWTKYLISSRKRKSKWPVNFTYWLASQCVTNLLLPSPPLFPWAGSLLTLLVLWHPVPGCFCQPPTWEHPPESTRAWTSHSRLPCGIDTLLIPPGLWLLFPGCPCLNELLILWQMISSTILSLSKCGRWC